MQKKDIHVGETYAYKVHKHARAIKVEVIDFDARVQQGWGRSTVAGITVRNTEHDKTFACTGRQLHHTWAEEEAIQKRAAEWAATQRAERESTAARRAATAHRIDGILSAHGEEPKAKSVYRLEDINALKAIGYEFVKTEPYGQHMTLSRFDLDTFMQYGRVDEKTLGVLIADVEVGA